MLRSLQTAMELLYMISLADMPGGPDGPQGGPENGAPGTDGPGGGAQSAPTSYSSVKEFTSDTE